ncbi:MAG: PEGA domain-containing protein [Firmicutes bacterium]|nr:PEGA domain-containing protein [Bacillota bacterium]
MRLVILFSLVFFLFSVRTATAVAVEETWVVRVESKPSGARIYLNGRDTGFTTHHLFTGLREGN